MKTAGLTLTCVALVLLLVGCGGSSGSNGTGLRFGAANGFTYSSSIIKCQQPLTVTDTKAAFSGAGFTVTYVGVLPEGQPDGYTFADPAPSLTGSQLETMIPNHAPVGYYKVVVQQGATIYNTGYIQFTGC